MSAPGNERRVVLLDTGYAYDGMSGDYHKTYFLRNKTIAVKIGGTATVSVYGRVNGVRAKIVENITQNSLIKDDIMIDEMKAVVESWTDGPVMVSILGD